MDLNNVKFRVKNVEEAKRFQELCFSHGIDWTSGLKEVSYSGEFGYIVKDGCLTYVNSKGSFNEKLEKEVEFIFTLDFVKEKEKVKITQKKLDMILAGNYEVEQEND